MLTVVLALPASAFAPSDTFHIGIEPHRVEWNHPHEQARLTAESTAFAAFRAEFGEGWHVRWDETTRTPRELWGEGVPVPVGSEAEVVAAVGAFFRDHADLFGFDPAQIRPESAAYDADSDTWYLDYDVEREPGVTTYRGGLTARVKFGNLILARAATAPASPVTGRWGLDASVAQRRARELGPAPTAKHTEESVERRLLERWTGDGLVLRRVFEVRSRTAEPPGIWVSFVDAETGELLGVHNEVRFVNGEVTARVHADTPVSNLVERPMPLIRVQGSSTVYADEQGRFSMNAGPYRVGITGDYVTVDNRGGTDGGATSNNATFTLDTGDATQAELDTYVFVHDARDWGTDLASSNGMVARDVRANVNLNQVCNAYFDGQSVNFFRAGGGCTNTGENDDVVHHEWGHGFHLYQIRSGVFDGSLSEGAADTVAFFQSGSPLIGPYFFNNGAPVRDVSPNRVYPDDYRNNDYFVHDNGLIFGGAIWDLWDALVDAEGQSRGTDSAETIFVGLLRGGPTIPESYGEALVADDDDGNINNGTPHGCQIDEAFGLHGLTPGGGGATSAVATHEPTPTIDADTAVTLRFDLPQDTECFTGIADEAVLHWRKGEGDWKDVAATLDGGVVRAKLPPQAADTFVEYWLEGVDIDGNSFRSPASGRVAPYSVYVGPVIEVACDDFTKVGDWKSKVVSGNGADPWQLAAPQGNGGDPASAYSGNKAWGTKLDGDGLYPANTVTRLRSAVIPTRHFERVFLQYRRWLRVEDQAYDQATIEVNGERVWKNGGTNELVGHTLDEQWMSHSVDLHRKADRGDAVIDFAIDADDGAEFGGWNLDDLCLLAPDTPDNRLGIGDLAILSDEGGVLTLTWTYPSDERVERVVLVKRTDEFPSGADDGTIVAEFTDFEHGGPGVFVDAFLDDDNFYAIYATDGTDWSSFTIEGVNAVEYDPAGSALLPFVRGVVGAARACGCDSGGSGAAWLAVAAGLVAIRRRR